jgi:hypothetical protein
MTDSNVDTGLATPAQPVTPTNRTGALSMAIVVVAIVLVIGAVVALGWVFLGGMLFASASSQVTSSSPQIVVSQDTTTASAAETPADETLSNSFTFRNVFEPSVEPVASHVTTGSSNSTSMDSDPPLATFKWNGVTYAVAEGEQVDSSPWQVVMIAEDSVLMLYGDTQVTITVGHSVSK